MTTLTAVEAAAIYEALLNWRLPNLAGKFAQDYESRIPLAQREAFVSLISEKVEAAQ